MQTMVGSTGKLSVPRCLPGGCFMPPGGARGDWLALRCCGACRVVWARTQRAVSLVVQRVIQRVEAGRARLDLVPVALPVAIEANSGGGDVCTTRVSTRAKVPQRAGTAPAMFTFWRTNSPASPCRWRQLLARVHAAGKRQRQQQLRRAVCARTGRLSQEAQRRIRRAVQHRSRRVRNRRWRIVGGAGLRRRRLADGASALIAAEQSAACARPRACPYCGAYWGCPPYCGCGG